MPFGSCEDGWHLRWPLSWLCNRCCQGLIRVLVFPMLSSKPHHRKAKSKAASVCKVPACKSRAANACKYMQVVMFILVHAWSATGGLCFQCHQRPLGILSQSYIQVSTQLPPAAAHPRSFSLCTTADAAYTFVYSARQLGRLYCDGLGL
jgi:hypothetical protein